MMDDINLKTRLTAAPDVRSVSVTSDGKVKLEWKKVPLAEKYDIKRSLSCKGDFVHIDWAEETEFTDSGVERDTTYWYKVIAWKRMEGKKTSQKASAVKGVTVSDIPCVKNLTAKAQNDGSIKLSWDADEGDKFFIYRKCAYYSGMIFIGESNTGTFVDEKAVSGQVYRYCVQTVKKEGERELHGNFSMDVACAYVDSTEFTCIKKTLGNKAVLEARVVAGAQGYIFERSDKKDGEFIQVAKTEGITEVNFTEKLPSRFRTYYYRVCAYKKVDGKEVDGEYSAVKALR